MRYGDRELRARDGRERADGVEVTVDGRRKVFDRGLAELLLRTGVQEPGLELPESAWRAA